MAEEHGVAVFQPERLRKDEDALAALRAQEADLFVVMAYGQILPHEAIEMPRLACVNLHASLLPRHRGAAPIQSAILAGDESSGVTLMHIEQKLDAGPMIHKEAIELAPDETGGSLHDRLAELSPLVLGNGLPPLLADPGRGETQDDAQATHCGKLGREDGLIDWAQSAAEIERCIRAFDPWPGTASVLQNGSAGEPQQVKIFPPAEVIADSSSSTPGTIESTEGGSILVTCGEGQLRLTGPWQVPGKKRIPLADLLRGFPIEEGARFQLT